ncbi:ABC transporter substrate-binding protein [Actinomyces provencensis]|uniref:ABC transporter substrate-binding protein n=1 Tax=Actinomyces provencensis TaxID=1720198 RepID=UPI00098F398A|nr:ABC transporter substrate-binding protein [Actinomyces provencensis]
MRRGLTGIGALSAAAALVLAGCAGSGGTSQSSGAGADGAQSAAVNEDGTVNNPEAVDVDPNKLVFWSLFSGGDGEFMDQIIDEYNATNPPKQVQSVMLVWADYYTKLQTAVAAGRGPDIGVSHISKLPELVAKGVVQPIDDYTAGAGTDWSAFPDNSLSGVTFDDQHYAIPLDTHAEIMYSNLDILSEAGVPVDADGQVSISNVDEFKSVLDKIKASAGSDVSPLALPQNGDDPYRVWWATYFQMGGTPIISDDGETITLDQATAVKAAEFVNSLYKDGYILPGIADHQKLFQEGKGGLEFGGTWAVGAFEQTDALNFSAQTFPSLFNGSDATWADSHVLTIPTNPKRSDEDTQAAVDFINFVASKGATIWAKSGQIPANSAVTSDPAFAELPFRSNYLSAKETAVLPPQTEYFYGLKSVMIENLDAIWSGQSDESSAIENMISEMEAEIG